MSPILEIRPGSMSNKGGELMLRAAVLELRDVYDLAAEPWIGPYAARARLGLYQKLWIKRLGPAATVPAAILPRRLRSMFGVVGESEIAGVLDAAGFSYGDQFGPARTERVAAWAEGWRRAGKPVVLLPQAFGPFTGARMRKAAARLVAAADLAFARDRSSLEAIRGLDVDSEHVTLAPDFTNLVPGTSPVRAGAEASASGNAASGTAVAYIVPNVRMHQQLPPDAARAYVPFLAACLREIERRDVEARILVHEGRDDAKLAAELRTAAGGRHLIVTDDDPQVLKGLIGASRLVVGSRYHALVAALSQAVPVVATGWSHKYRELLADYGCADALVAMPAADGEAAAAVAAALVDPARVALVQRLQAAAEQQRARSREMWAKVRRLLASRIDTAATA